MMKRPAHERYTQCFNEAAEKQGVECLARPGIAGIYREVNSG